LLRFGVIGLGVIGLVGVGGWLHGSGTAERFSNAAQEKFYAVTAQNGFVIQDILVEGRMHADPAVLLGLLDIGRGDPTFAFDPVRARQALERENWIASARVERRLPGLVFVRIEERTPFAFWQHQGKIRLIDPNGIVITDVAEDMASFSNLPLVVGDGAQNAALSLVEMLRAEPDLFSRLEAATYVGGRRWDLKMKNNVTVRLPEQDLGLSLRRLAEAHGKDRLLEQDLDSIDLRETGRLIVRTRPGMVQDYQASFKAGSAI